MNDTRHPLRTWRYLQRPRWTQIHLAEQVGCHSSIICRLERGKKIPQPVVEKIAAVTKLSRDKLMSGYA